jgi:hypothetical protein
LSPAENALAWDWCSQNLNAVDARDTKKQLEGN